MERKEEENRRLSLELKTQGVNLKIYAGSRNKGNSVPNLLEETREQLNSTRRDLEKIKTEKSTSESSFQELVEEKDVLLAKIHDLEETIDELGKKSEEYKKSLIEKDRSFHRLQHEFDVLKAQSSKSDKSSKIREKMIEELEQSQIHSKNSLESKEEEIQNLKKVCNDQKENLKIKENEINDLKNQIKSLKKELESIEKVRNDQLNKLELEKNKNKTLEENYNSTMKQADGLRSTIKFMEKQKDNMIKIHETALLELQEKITRLEKLSDLHEHNLAKNAFMIQKLQEDNSQYVETIETLNNNGRKIKSKITEYQNKIMEAKEEIAGFTKICSEHEEEQECLRKELKRKEKELLDLNQDLEEMKTLAQKYNGKLMAVLQENEMLKKGNEQLNNTIDELSKKLEEHGNCSEEISTLSREIQTLEASNQIKDEMYKKMKKIIRKLDKKANNALQREIDFLLMANNELEKKLEDDRINCEEKSKLLEKLQIYGGKFKQSLKQNRKLIQLVEKLQKCHETCSRCNSEETWSYYNDNEEASSEISATDGTEESLIDVQEYDESD